MEHLSTWDTGALRTGFYSALSWSKPASIRRTKRGSRLQTHKKMISQFTKTIVNRVNSIHQKPLKVSKKKVVRQKWARSGGCCVPDLDPCEEKVPAYSGYVDW